mmetsp:Transcript_110270/g.308371  ORF Transcript_110270/g.308371 Transcript_110270/m.308371 type:complete len:226 (+) Transcript_110270:129-806(+)
MAALRSSSAVSSMCMVSRMNISRSRPSISLVSSETAAALSSRRRISRRYSSSSAHTSWKMSPVWPSLLYTSWMSLDFALPFMRRMPFVNSTMVSTLSPSSMISQLSSISCFVRSSRLRTCLTCGCDRADLNSSYVRSPEPSLSSSRNMLDSTLSSRRFSCSASFATFSLSSLAILNAFSTTTAVMRFQNTNTPSITKSMKKKPDKGAVAMIGRMTVMKYVSSVMI